MSTVKISDSGGREVLVTTDKALKVDGSEVTQPVSVIAGNNVIGQVKLTDGTDVADVLDLPNSNPLTVAIVDANGDQIASFGGGTQYTEDAAAAANPVGTVPILIRSDTPATIVTTDGDNVAQRGTNYGAAYSQIVTSSGAFVDTFGGGTQYTEDVASAADPIGNQLIARRRDALGAETTTDGDNVAVNSTNKGELYVKHVDAIPVTDNGSSLTVDATNLDIRDLTFAADKVDVSGSVLGAGTNNIGDVDVLTIPPVTNGGTFVVQENGAALTALQLIDDAVFVDDTATHATGTTKGLGVMAVANPTDSAIDANDIGMLAMTLARALKIDITTLAGTAVDTNSGNKSAGTQRMVVATDQPQLTTPLNVTIQAGSTGGDTVYHLVSAATTNATNIKASAGKVTGWYIYNSNAAARKLVFHNSASAPTAGASVYFSIMIPPSSGANVSFPDGIDFSAGIGITTVTGLADSDSAAVAVNDLIINIFYK